MWGTHKINLGAAALANRAIARNTVVHELKHYGDFLSGMPLKTIGHRNILEHRAHLLDINKAHSWRKCSKGSLLPHR